MKTSNHQIYKEVFREFKCWTNDFLVYYQMQIVFEIIWNKISDEDKREHQTELLEGICGQFYELYYDGYLK